MCRGSCATCAVQLCSCVCCKICCKFGSARSTGVKLLYAFLLLLSSWASLPTGDAKKRRQLSHEQKEARRKLAADKKAKKKAEAEELKRKNREMKARMAAAKKKGKI